MAKNSLKFSEHNLLLSDDATQALVNVVDTNAMEGVLEVSHSLELKS